ncbi:MAG: ABC transporter substrate-binding protein [Acidobacteria bacterium]|nr:MAG: ABC transporter substrate-binding protein [Acidobacteriota bacterium]
MRYFFRRLIHTMFLLLGVSVLSFLFVALAPGDYFEEMRLNPQISQATVAAMRSKYGLDQPLPKRYFRWMQSVLRGELGFSFSYDTPVRPLLVARAKNTLLLTATAALLSWLVAIPLGVWSSSRKAKWLDRVLTLGTTTLLAIPDLMLALVLLLIALRTGWFPTGGLHDIRFSRLNAWGKVEDTVAHIFLPVMCLVLGSLPILFRHIRSALVEVLDSPFIRSARGHGIPEGRVLFLYALPAAANPLISLFGFSVGTLLSASLLVEVLMSWPGIGPLLVEAILARDIYLVIGAVMFSTLFLVGGNLLADLLLYLADPRIRME